MLIPPSILMVVYGVITEESIGKWFAAGMGPAWWWQARSRWRSS